jgi:hypothetical protein
MSLLATSPKNAKRAFAQARALTTLLPIHMISILQVSSFCNLVAQMLVATFTVKFKVSGIIAPCMAKQHSHHGAVYSCHMKELIRYQSLTKA